MGAIDTKKVLVAMKGESTPGTNAFSGSPTGNEWVKVDEPNTLLSVDTEPDDSSGPERPGFLAVPTNNNYRHTGRIEIPWLTVADANSRPRGYQIFLAAGGSFAYDAGPPKVLTCTFPAGGGQTITVQHYHRPRGWGASLNALLKSVYGYRCNITQIGYVNGKLFATYEGEGSGGAQSQGASMPAASPFVDTNSAYVGPVQQRLLVTGTFQDSSGGNILGTKAIDSWSLNLGNTVNVLRASDGAGDPAEVHLDEGAITGTIRVRQTKALSDFNARSLIGGLPLVILLTHTSGSNVFTASFACTVTGVNDTQTGGVLYNDLQISAAYPDDGTAIARTPASPLALKWTTS